MFSFTSLKKNWQEKTKAHALYAAIFATIATFSFLLFVAFSPSSIFEGKWIKAEIVNWFPGISGCEFDSLNTCIHEQKKITTDENFVFGRPIFVNEIPFIQVKLLKEDGTPLGDEYVLSRQFANGTGNTGLLNVGPNYDNTIQVTLTSANTVKVTYHHVPSESDKAVIFDTTIAMRKGNAATVQTIFSVISENDRVEPGKPFNIWVGDHSNNIVTCEDNPEIKLKIGSLVFGIRSISGIMPNNEFTLNCYDKNAVYTKPDGMIDWVSPWNNSVPIQSIKIIPRKDTPKIYDYSLPSGLITDSSVKWLLVMDEDRIVQWRSPHGWYDNINLQPNISPNWQEYIAENGQPKPSTKRLNSGVTEAPYYYIWELSLPKTAFGSQKSEIEIRICSKVNPAICQEYTQDDKKLVSTFSS